MEADKRLGKVLVTGDGMPIRMGLTDTEEYMEIAGIRAVDQALEAAAASTAAKVERHDKAEQQELIRAVKSVNESGILGSNQEMTFLVDRETKRMVVRVVDRETEEVLLQIPDQQVLRMAEKLPKR